MAKFVDAAGTEWQLSISVLSVKRVNEKTGVMLTDLVSEDMSKLGELISNPVKFADVIYWICKPSIDKASVSDEEFFDRLAGETMVSAVEPFVEALADFFRPRQKMVLVSAVRKVLQASDMLAGAAQKRLDELSDQMLTSAALNSLASAE